MEKIVKGLLIVLVVVVMYQCEKDNEYKITDDKFLNALIEQGFDTNGDGKISPNEAEVITYLDVSEDSIADMTGIETFVNLDTLICWGNQLTNLNISNNIALIYLMCWKNQITKLDVSNNYNLK
jgi:hypothetical protein